MKALLLAGAVLATVACSTEPAAVRVEGHTTSAGGVDAGTDPGTRSPTAPADPTTTTTVPELVPSTVVVPVDPELNPPEPVATTVPRTTAAVRPTQLAPVVHGDDFWFRLAMCESGAGASSPNVFQFMGGTAEKVGYYAGASYEAQRAMAIDWAARIHPREGSTAGWPVCWWEAGGA